MTASRTLRMLLAAAAITASGIPQTLAAEALTIDELIEIEKKVIDSRRNIASVHLKVNVQEAKVSGENRTIERQWQYDIYHDGTQGRCDIRSGGTLLSQRIAAPDRFIRMAGPEHHVQYFAAHPIPRWKTEIPDPRRLGVVSWFLDTLSDHGLERHLLAPDRQNIQIAAAEVDGESIDKVTYDLQRRTGILHGEHWLARNKGNFPIYLAIQKGDGAERFIQCLQSTVRFHKKWNVWFPEKVVFRSVRGVDSTGDEETVTIEHVSFDPIDNKVFQIDGLGLPKGRIIDFDGKLLIWTGERLIRHTSQPLQEGATSPQDAGGWRHWILAAAALFSVAAAGALWLKWRKQ